MTRGTRWLHETLCLMKQRGSAVKLSWGEDNNLWECDWIVDGKRYSGTHRYVNDAVARALNKADKERA